MIRRWLMRVFGHPEQHIEPASPPNAAYTTGNHTAEKRAYEQEKRELVQRHVERLARLRRLGYDVDVITRKDRDVAR
jgi:hypothetical protein